MCKSVPGGNQWKRVKPHFVYMLLTWSRLEIILMLSEVISNDRSQSDSNVSRSERDNLVRLFLDNDLTRKHYHGLHTTRLGYLTMESEPYQRSSWTRALRTTAVRHPIVSETSTKNITTSWWGYTDYSVNDFELVMRLKRRQHSLFFGGDSSMYSTEWRHTEIDRSSVEPNNHQTITCGTCQIASKATDPFVVRRCLLQNPNENETCRVVNS